PRQVALGSAPSAFRTCKSEVANDLLFCAPSKLETAQSLVLARGPAEVERAQTGLREMPNRFPHDQIVSAELLLALVGRTILVECIISKVEEDCAGDRLRFATRENNETK